MKTISERGIAFITRLEGMRRNLYDDAAGLPTIGIGHLLTQDERKGGMIDVDGQDLVIANGLTIEQCYRLLRQDLRDPSATVNRSVIAEINQEQFEALVSFVFNVGSSAFNHSTLLRHINAGSFDRVPEEFRKWIYANGMTCEGLRRRREAEIELWNIGTKGERVESMLRIELMDPPKARFPWLKRIIPFLK